MTRRLRGLAVAATLLVAVGGCSSGDSGSATSGSDPGVTIGSTAARADFQWVIPKGTSEKVDQTTHDQIFPTVMYAKVGQTIRIINEDIIGYTVGPFYIGPGQTMFQRVQRTGIFEGLCTTHKDGRLVLIVE